MSELSVNSLWLNGKPADKIGLNDRSIQYGDGFFTTILVEDHRVMNWGAHWQRIENSCKALKMPLPDKIQIQQWVQHALVSYFESQQNASCVLKIVISRGEGGKGYAAPEQIQINTLFYIKPHAVNENSQPLKVGLCQTKASINDFAGVKSLNRIENVLARSEVHEKDCDEGIMQNALHEVVCGTQSNLYLIKDGIVITPRIDHSGVAGTCRDQLNLLLINNGWTLEERAVQLDEIEMADELFFTNAVRGVQPTAVFGKTEFKQDLSINISQLWQDWQQQTAIDINLIGKV